MTIKQAGKSLLCCLLEAQVRRLRVKNNFKIIAVVGSVGKTTTKIAITSVLKPQYKVQYQAGNYNDRLTVPLVFFSQSEPAIFNVIAWLKILAANEKVLRQPYGYEFVVLELGSDAPGQMQDFAYLRPDLVVVTALTDEHMLYFKTLDAVAQEELLATSFANQALINIDDSPKRYIAKIPHLGYGQAPTDFQLQTSASTINGQTLTVSLNAKPLTLQTNLLGLPGAKAVLAAAAVADWAGLSVAQIVANTPLISAVAGRMQLLAGQQNTTLIDDTYNSSPVAVKAALDVLYGMPTSQRIAVLGNMNEMGTLSPAMHEQVATYCDPQKLDLLVTIGRDANDHLAPAARKAGCTVVSCTDPYDAAVAVKKELQPNAVVLVKGSQNGVFSEETVKLLLANPDDASKLTRQSSFWLAKKRRQFGR